MDKDRYFNSLVFTLILHSDWQPWRLSTEYLLHRIATISHFSMVHHLPGSKMDALVLPQHQVSREYLLPRNRYGQPISYGFDHYFTIFRVPTCSRQDCTVLTIDNFAKRSTAIHFAFQWILFKVQELARDLFLYFSSLPSISQAPSQESNQIPLYPLPHSSYLWKWIEQTLEWLINRRCKHRTIHGNRT